MQVDCDLCWSEAGMALTSSVADVAMLYYLFQLNDSRTLPWTLDHAACPPVLVPLTLGPGVLLQLQLPLCFRVALPMTSA